VAVWIPTIASIHGVAARLTSIDGETTDWGKGETDGAGIGEILNKLILKVLRLF
jgi:hypothetical protein